MSETTIYIYVIILNLLSYLFTTLTGLIVIIDIFVVLSYITSCIMDKWYFNGR